MTTNATNFMNHLKWKLLLLLFTFSIGVSVQCKTVDFGDGPQCETWCGGKLEGR